MQATNKVIGLESLRGLAALAVLLLHLATAFTPDLTGRAPSTTGLVTGTVAWMANGTASVIVFFVLSGFVLPLAYFRTGRHEIIVRGVAKRWFRLAGLVAASTIAACLLMKLGLYFPKEAAVITGSQWLATMADAGDVQPSFAEAVHQGLFAAFFKNNAAYNHSYNRVLWTMFHEFFGSFLAYGLAVILLKTRPVVAVWFLALACIAAWNTDFWILCFIPGTALALWFSRHSFRPHPVLGGLCIFLGFCFFVYREPVGIYSWLEPLKNIPGPWQTDYLLLYPLAGVLMIYGILVCRPAARILQYAPFRFLGRISFALYLFHMPVLFSLGCWTFVQLYPSLGHKWAYGAMLLLYLPATILVSYLATLADERWVGFIDRISKKLIPSPSSAAERPSPAAPAPHSSQEYLSSRHGSALL